MDLQPLYTELREQLHDLAPCELKWIVGTAFYYIDRSAERTAIETALAALSMELMKGKQLHCDTVYVRTTATQYVYRHRFYVPQRKMFCCGNLCPTCIRFTNYLPT